MNWHRNFESFYSNLIKDKNRSTSFVGGFREIGAPTVICSELRIWIRSVGAGQILPSSSSLFVFGFGEFFVG